MFNRNTVRGSWKAAALMVVLPLALASPAVASAGQQVEQGVVPASQAVVSSAAIDTSCGVLPPECIVRLDRATSRRARDAQQLGGSLPVAICASVPGPGTACAIAIGLAAQTLAKVASNYYEDGDCLGLRIRLFPNPIPTPERVKRGEHNCS